MHGEQVDAVLLRPVQLDLGLTGHDHGDGLVVMLGNLLSEGSHALYIG